MNEPNGVHLSQELDRAMFVWPHTMIIGFLDTSPNQRHLAFRLADIWKTLPPFNVQPYVNIFFLVHLGCDQDLALVTLGAPWLLNGRVILVEKWKDIDYSLCSMNSIPIWVNLWNFPCGAWDKEIIKRIVRPIGSFNLCFHHRAIPK